jgi:MoaA/NifB/PqqE/SkfB family radical SAM enzyme
MRWPSRLVVDEEVVVYRILKEFGGGRVFLNDSEGEPMEWEDWEEAMRWVRFCQENTKNGSTYKLIDSYGRELSITEPSDKSKKID